jgi:hypothetical protein
MKSMRASTTFNNYETEPNSMRTSHDKGFDFHPEPLPPSTAERNQRWSQFKTNQF